MSGHAAMQARLATIAALAAAAVVSLTAQQAPAQDDKERFKFRSAVELVNVTTTVTDASGRFVRGLRQEDFHVFEDGHEQPLTHFSAERVPVSLGIVLDTSNSMDGEKMEAARDALSRFLLDLLEPEDEVFLYRFSDVPELVEGWTTNRQRLQSRLQRLVPDGGTAMYDAIVEAIPLAQSGRHRKKALLIISDGNDSDSAVTVAEVKRQIRQSEILVYAIGIDRLSTTTTYGGGQGGTRQPPQTFPFPFPFPGPRRVPPAPPRSPTMPQGSGPADRVNAQALREITDDSGGRTEIVRTPRDLDPATAGISDELSQQYSLGYASTGKDDGRWHTITVEVDRPGLRVRARRGFVANK